MYSFKLTEEIARWAFEIICKENQDWYIAFTNPTAGPWKTIKGINNSGIEGEVYRFESKEPRPDIILVNDQLKLIIIIEAKDSIKKLTNGDQVAKSIEVVHTLHGILKGNNAKNNPFWGKRADYDLITGLLWGTENQTTLEERSNTFDEYHRKITTFPQLLDNIIIGIETRRTGEELNCYFCGKTYHSASTSPSLDNIALSFGLSTF